MTADERLADLLKITYETLKDKERAAMGDDPSLFLETIPIGVMELDKILGGGWRRGRMGLIVGEASMGKTLITQWTIAAFQAKGYTCGFVDPERTFDAPWFTKTGVDVSKLIVVRPESTEQTFDLVTEWLRNKIDLVVIDSLAALVPKMRIENTLVDRQVMGLGAAKIKEGIQQINNANTRSVILCTNQLSSKIGVVYGSPDTIPGGRAQRFFASYILHARRAEWITEGTDRVGYSLKVTTEKNKLCPPYQEARVPFLFSGVIDTIGGLVDLAKEMGIVGKGGYFRWDDQVIHGAPTFKDYLAEHEDARQALQTAVEEAMQDAADFGAEVPLTEEEEAEYNSRVEASVSEDDF